jgi:hypothetical protein
MIRSIVVLSCVTAAFGAEAAAPCIAAGPECTEKVALGPQDRYSMVYRSFALTAANPRIERALIVIHGAGRNADDYFASGLAGALVAGVLDSTVVISPRIASATGTGCSDSLAPGEISWICGGENDWRRGGAADGIKNVFTYTLIDEIVRKLGRRGVFPNLKSIVVTGHSAGGQFTNRYAASTAVNKEVSIPIRYVVANPSSYLYLDDRRLTPGASCSPNGTCDGEFLAFAGKPDCEAFNYWHYGMERRVGYAAPVSDELIKRRLVGRDVVYLLGELDTLPLFGFDSSCGAMAQGPTRFARGVAYWNYLNGKHGARHKLVRVAACGHNGRCMYTSNESLPVLYPK